jgi:hypothetical protein
MQNIIDGIEHSSYNELMRLCQCSATPKISNGPKCFIRLYKKWSKRPLHNSFNELDIGIKPSFQNKNFPVRKLMAHIKQDPQQNSKHQHIANKFNYAIPISHLNQEKRLKNASVDFLKCLNSNCSPKFKHHPITRDDIKITIRYRPYRTIQKETKNSDTSKDKFILPNLPHSISHHTECRFNLLHSKITQKKNNQISVIAAKIAQGTPKPMHKINFQTTLAKQSFRKVSPISIIRTVPPLIFTHTRNTVFLDKKKIRALTLRQRSFDSVELSPWDDDENIME